MTFFRVLAGAIALGALLAGIALAVLTHFSLSGLGSLAFMLIWVVVFGRVALTGRGLTKFPYEPSD